jgi:hypothetical protein
MLKVVKLDKDHIDEVFRNFTRDQLPFHEYPFLSDEQLVDYYAKSLFKVCDTNNSGALAIVSEKKLQGLVICHKDAFDSENFGFPCYKVTDLLVFSEEYNNVVRIVDLLFDSLEEELISISKPFYLTLSLNNNTRTTNSIFNALTARNFYYIHTLLTFCNLNRHFDASTHYEKEGITIRIAGPEDAEQVSDLAQRSFKLSRFHMDPFLNNEAANILLGISAKNSILQHFVDVMFVAEINKKVVGYFSAKKRYISEFERMVGESGISAIDENFRGRGIFAKLNAHILNWYSDNTSFAELGTYLANYPVHKTFINCGLGLIRGSHQFSKMKQ